MKKIQIDNNESWGRYEVRNLERSVSYFNCLLYEIEIPEELTLNNLFNTLMILLIHRPFRFDNHKYEIALIFTNINQEIN